MRVPLPPAPPVESRVFASRFISWSRKSSFLPISPLRRQQLAEVADVGSHASQFLGMSLRSTITATSSNNLCRLNSGPVAASSAR